MEKLEDLFIKCCINSYRTWEINEYTKKMEPLPYRSSDLYEWAKEFYEKGVDFFYAEPVNPDDIYGKLKLTEPKYVYKLKRPLTEDEYKEIIKRHEK